MPENECVQCVNVCGGDMVEARTHTAKGIRGALQVADRQRIYTGLGREPVHTLQDPLHLTRALLKARATPAMVTSSSVGPTPPVVNTTSTAADMSLSSDAMTSALSGTKTTRVTWGGEEGGRCCIVACNSHCPPAPQHGMLHTNLSPHAIPLTCHPMSCSSEQRNGVLLSST